MASVPKTQSGAGREEFCRRMDRGNLAPLDPVAPFGRTSPIFSFQLLPQGLRSSPHRATDATMYSVAEGTGKARIGAASFSFEPKDCFVVPSWQPVSLEAKDECVLFSYSDRSAQVALGIWREQRS